MTFTCPRCGRTSHHPEDARHGYCGACHAFTGGDQMVKATMKTHDGQHVLMLGLSRENTNRLHQGMPILLSAHEVDASLPELQIVILAGETEDSITAELRRAFPA